MGENAAHLIGDSLLWPIGMLTLQESGFMSAASPVKAVRRAPPLLGRHAPENGELFRTRLLIRKHDGNVRRKT
jgi:hypothetical protein